MTQTTKRRAGGRKTKLAHGNEAVVRFIHATRLGASRVAACRYAGLAPSTVFAWMARGRRARSGKFLEFLERVREADGHAELHLLAQIQTAAKRDWRAAAWMLERKFPKRWGKREHLTHAGDRDQPVVFKLDIPLPPGVQEKLDREREGARAITNSPEH